MASKRILVLISGNGTNLQALIDAAASSKIPNANIIHVISNRKDAYGLQRAGKVGISTSYHNLLKYKKQYCDQSVENVRAIYDKDLAEMVLQNTPDIVVCAGFMHILADNFLQPLQEAGIPIINLHPALPGQFDGVDAIGRAYQAFQRQEITKTGIMIHYVISEVDMGEPILVEEIELKHGESLQDLEQRIHVAEWRAIVEGTKMVLSMSR
ncbi:hypothetical protein MMC34_007347 [Xylographa carneopallida]|nr:hypothetical protein [Xylographa carneopallida]